ncbi:MAG: dual specificity protein phosphatase family protein [Verrucomicrobia bacterium]|nr:dual specificity protein phosphatase family protein [Verrucomicrobiota bacterium]
MKFGLIFSALAVALVGSALVAECSAVAGVQLYAAVSCAALGIGYLSRRPAILLKRGDGRFAWPSWLLFAPYHIFNHVFLEVFRRTSREPRWTEIVPGLWLGGRLRPWDEVKWKNETRLGRAANDAPSFSVLDVTGEFAEVQWLRAADSYLCQPMLDTTAPTTEQLRCGLDFIRERLAHGPVYVHCAFGHSRSATFVIAHLVAAGHSKTVTEAIAFTRSKRPRVRLNGEQLESLDRFFNNPSASHE